MELVLLELRPDTGQTPQGQPEKGNRAPAIRNVGRTRAFDEDVKI
jgi:hypothetical protein